MTWSPGYIEVVREIERLITEWCAARDTLPDLRFYKSPAGCMFTAGLDQNGRKLLAISPDAFSLLAFLEAKTHEQATVFQVTFVLEQLGYLEGAEQLTSARVRELGFVAVEGV